MAVESVRRSCYDTYTIIYFAHVCIVYVRLAQARPNNHLYTTIIAHCTVHSLCGIQINHSGARRGSPQVL